MEKPVQEWDLGTYPDKDPRNGKPASDWFKFSYLLPNGDVAHRVVKEKVLQGRNGPTIEVEKRGQPRETAITGGGSPMVMTKKRGAIPGENIPRVWMPEPHDIRKAETEIGSKPTIVRMGLWHKPDFSDEGELMGWIPVDRRKSPQPPFWYDITDKFYEIRAKCYENTIDPYKNSKRPYTRMQEAQVELKQKDKAIEMLTAKKNNEIAELKAELAKAAKKKNNAD